MAGCDGDVLLTTEDILLQVTVWDFGRKSPKLKSSKFNLKQEGGPENHQRGQKRQHQRRSVRNTNKVRTGRNSAVVLLPFAVLSFGSTCCLWLNTYRISFDRPALFGRSTIADFRPLRGPISMIHHSQLLRQLQFVKLTAK